MGKVPNLVHEANVAGRNKPKAEVFKTIKGVNNEPTREQILERLRALEGNPTGQQQFLDAVTLGWSLDDVYKLTDEV
jgi:hypothetical protein